MLSFAKVLAGSNCSILSRTGVKGIVTLGLVAGIIGVMAAPASANTWYVSHKKPTRPPDGKSWDSPWSDLNRLDWTKIQPGDVIKVHADRAHYSALKIQKDYIKVEAADEQANSSNVVWIMGSRVSPAIDIGNFRHVEICGSRWIGDGAQKAPNLSVIALNGIGVNIGPGAEDTRLHDMQFHMCDSGIKALGGKTYCYRVRMNNNIRGVSYSPASGPKLHWIRMNDSWIYNDGRLYLPSIPEGQPWYRRNCAGIVTSGESDNLTSVSVSNTILGPGLATSLDCNSKKSDVDLNAVVSINPSETVYKIANVHTLTIRYCTSFLTALNKEGKATTCLSYPSPKSSDEVSGSIFYGGNVNVDNSTSFAFRINTQFKTSGNTLVISAEQKDPKFTSDVSTITNRATFQMLRDLNFKPAPGSPVFNADSWVYPTSVAEFLNSK